MGKLSAILAGNYGNAANTALAGNDPGPIPDFLDRTKNDLGAAAVTKALAVKASTPIAGRLSCTCPA